MPPPPKLLLLLLLLLGALLPLPRAVAAAPPAPPKSKRRPPAPSSSPARGAASSSSSSQVARGDERPPLKYVTTVKCPFAARNLSPPDLVNDVMAKLVPEGRLDAALGCLQLAVGDIDGGRFNVSDEVEDVVRENARILTEMLSPKRDSSLKRIYHNLEGKDADLPAHTSAELAPPSCEVDKHIQVFDGLFTADQCAEIVALFEASESHQGVELINGEVVVDIAHKKAREYLISAEGALRSEAWAKVDRWLMGAVTKALAMYEDINTIVRLWKNPLFDEGFRMKRYVNDGTEHQAWHADSSGQDPATAPRRLIAFLIYVNDVEEGGETAFLNQGLAVKPQCGRVVLFPTAYPYVHAARRPVSNTKYIIVNFIDA